MMATSKPVLFFLILFLGIIFAVVIEEDEFYCKMEKEKFRICTCLPYKQCQWSVKAIEDIENIPNDDPRKREEMIFFQRFLQDH